MVALLTILINLQRALLLKEARNMKDFIGILAGIFTTIAAVPQI